MIRQLVSSKPRCPGQQQPAAEGSFLRAINFGENVKYPIDERSEPMAFPSRPALVMYAWLACTHGRWDSHRARSRTQWHTPHEKPGLNNPDLDIKGYTVSGL